MNVQARLATVLGAEAEIEQVIVDLPDRICMRVALEGGPVLAKVDLSAERSEREALALAVARAGGIGVPEIVLHDPVPPAVLVLAWVDGTPLSAAADGWRAVGEQLRRLHQLPIPRGLRRFDHRDPTWPDFLRWWVDHETALCAQVGALAPSEAEWIRDGLLAALRDVPEPQRAFLHGDLQPNHVLFDDGLPVIVDWGDAGTGDPLWDLAVLLLDHAEHGPDVLAGYQPSPQLRAHFDAHLHPYRLVRYLGEITWLLDRGFDASCSIAGARQTATEL